MTPRPLVAAMIAVTLLPGRGDAAYAGHVRTASAAFRLRGLDGHTITLTVKVESSGLGGTTVYDDLYLAIRDCVGTRCTDSPAYRRALRSGEYSASTDLSVTTLGVPLGGLLLMVAWSSAAGFGRIPPTADTSHGVAMTTTRPADAVLLVGPSHRGALRRYARCLDPAATVASSVTLTSGTRTAENWPATPPRGLVTKELSSRMFGCAR